jgi:2-amino-4-hydroxy-6-hydroxymethyldihydropteridine diphosphokinase
MNNIESINTEEQYKKALEKISQSMNSPALLEKSEEEEFNDLFTLVEAYEDKHYPIPTLKTVYLSLGSNLGDRKEILEKAIVLLSEKVGVVVKQSKDYETVPWGVTDQPDFLNLAIEIHTLLKPLEVLEQTQSIENQLGRVRKEKWGARLIDIDILFYGNEIIDEPNLKIPHPLIQERDFVLTPMAEIAPNFVHPLLGETNMELKDILLKAIPKI